MKLDKKKLLTGILALVIAACSYVVTEYLQEKPAVSGDGLIVQFIDVGQADCALLQCDGQFMLIDGGNRDDSQLVVSFLEQQGVKELAAVVCTHAHEDHVGGLPAVLAVYPTKAVYAPTKTYSSKIFDKFVYYTDQQGLTITIPQPGDGFDLGQARVTVLGPVKSYPDTNNTSLVLRVEYGETAFLFTGDMEEDEESESVSVGGWVLEQLGKMAEVGDTFEYKNLSVTVTDVEQRRVIEISVKVEEPKEESEEDKEG